MCCNQKIIAGIDCGTNTVRLLISNVTGYKTKNAKFKDILRETRLVFLGEGMDKTRQFSNDSLLRLKKCLSEYSLLCKQNMVEIIKFTATSAARDAKNKQEFLALSKKIIGIEPEVIDGKKEGELAFYGATISIKNNKELQKNSIDNALVVDIGGGSTEFSYGKIGSLPSQVVSLDIGSTRITEKFFTYKKLPTQTQIKDATSFIFSQLKTVHNLLEKTPKVLVGVAGTVGTLCAFSLNLSEYNPKLIILTQMPVQEAINTCNIVLSKNCNELQEYSFLPSKRAFVLHAGTLIWKCILEKIISFNNSSSTDFQEYIISEHGILDGMIAL